MLPRVQLDVRRTLDLDALEHGHSIFIYRCFARLRFRHPTGWGDERFAVLDTGAPFSVIPGTVWQALVVHRLFPAQLRGIVPHTTASLPAQLARIECVLTDEQHVSPPLELTALLVEAPDVPIILGWSGCLDRAKLTLDPPRHTAWLEF